MHTVEPGIWRENWKSRKMRNAKFRTCNMARKTEKGWKFRNVKCRMWNMARKLKIMENEKHPLDELKNDEITEKSEKWEMHTEAPGIWRENWNHGKWEINILGREIWRGKLKNVENLDMSTVGRGIWQENWKSWKMRKIHLTIKKWRNHWKTWNMRNAHCRT